MTNKEFSESNKWFRESCINAKLPPTTRQASKWIMKKGLAWKLNKAYPLTGGDPINEIHD